MSYCKKTCTKLTSIQSLVKDVDNGECFVVTSYVISLLIYVFVIVIIPSVFISV